MQSESPQSKYRTVIDTLDQLISSNDLPGASVLVRQGGKEELFYASGMNDVDAASPIQRNTVFRLFSMTKPITAAAVMILVDDGVLRLDDEVAAHIPELAELGVYRGQDDGVVQSMPARPITIEHLLTHTAGFSYWFYPESPVGALYASDPTIGTGEFYRFDPALGGLDGLARALGRLPLVNQPGERWHYGMSLDVAGIVVERASRTPLAEFMRTRIFEPLAMNDTAFSVEAGQADRLASLYGPKAGGGIELIERGVESPLLKAVPGACGGGGLVSTIDDYSRFAEMLRRGGELDGRRILSEASVRAMMTNQLEPEQLAELPGLAALGLGGTGNGLGFGLGGAVVLDPPSDGIPAFRGEYSWGGGASTTFWVDPENQLTVVFMTQVQPPNRALMLRDKLHSVIYGAMGLADATPIEKRVVTA